MFDPNISREIFEQRFLHSGRPCFVVRTCSFPGCRHLRVSELMAFFRIVIISQK